SPTRSPGPAYRTAPLRTRYSKRPSAENGCVLPALGTAGRTAYPSAETSRSPEASRSQIDDCRLPIEVSNARPSGVNATPSSSPGPNEICSGTPSGKGCRQRWKLPVLLEEKYIHFPSGDQA